MGSSRLVLAVLAASALSALITALALRPDTTGAPPSSPDQRPDWAELNANLKELIGALQPLSAHGPRPLDPTDPMPRTSAAEPILLETIAQHLEDLKGLVASQSWQGSGQVELAEAGLRQPDAQWQVLGDLSQRLKADRDAASRQLFFLTPAMVLQRYGRPYLINASSDGSVRWYYHNEKEGDARVDVYITFKDGYVISAF